MSDDDMTIEERLAPALDALKATDEHTEQRERWLRELASTGVHGEGWGARALYWVAEAWVENKYGGPS